MRRERGLFIVFEGLDGSGTTTQAKLLHRHLGAKGMKSVLTCEPTDEPVGKLIRDALSGKLASPRTDNRFVLSEKALCLLFAADRIEHSTFIEENRRDGSKVICDRYVLSSIAYQSLDPSVSPERVVDVNNGCAVPDVTFLLKVSVSECLRRLEHRRESPTVYEKRELLERIDRNYEKTRTLYEQNFGPLVTLDGTQEPGRIHETVVEMLAEYIGS